MNIRIDIRLDHESESTRWIETARLAGKRLHEIDEYGAARKPVARWPRRRQSGWKLINTQCQTTVG